MATLFLNGCAHTSMSSSYMSSSYNNNSSTIENVIGYSLLAAAATGLVLAAVNSDSDDNHYRKHSFSDNHDKHQRPHHDKPQKRPHKV